MDQDTLRSLLREAVRETVTEVPAFLKPYARRLVDVGEVAVALYGAGVSQRKAAEAFRRRLLPEEMAFVHLDGPSPKVFKGRRGDCAGNRVRGRGGHAFRGAAGPGVLAVAHGERAGWERVLRELWQRGLAGPALRHRRATRAP